ncbi:MalY/PatB family protein [Marinilabilia rubra]|uniref:cysteine-S-conjugate beta-lyase n=1 Tax=Marinilabilia rubra TaxID=2162893 RepID=A0A2U2BAL7_9BACT|nr:PatB family C-S lyase [Marinilabilia rubra]PWE00115.1 cystathionine beta-lyase [Marinilabilia rubra]
MDFDRKIDRSGTNALKYEFRKRVFGTGDVIPLWVADMDFAVPPEVSEAIQKRAEHPIFGYTARDEKFYQAIQQWQKNQHDWDVPIDWLEYMPGVVPTLILAIQAFSNPGDKVVIQPPVYPPFFDVIKDHGRVIEGNPLVNTPEGYRLDFDHLQKVTAKPSVKMLLLCHPHNPVGRVWTRDELVKLGEICLKNNVLVVSDEIHADLVHKGHKHIPFASLREDFAANSVTCMAPSKTFNIAGLNTSYIVTPDDKIRKAMQKQLQAYHLFTGNMFGAEALKAAYTLGQSWLNELLDYIQGNIDYVMEFAAQNMPEVKIHKPEATYLMWLDFSAWGLSDAKLRKFIIEQAGIGLNYGPTFGKEQGANFHRLNVASPYKVIEEAMDRLLEARNTIAK